MCTVSVPVIRVISVLFLIFVSVCSVACVFRISIAACHFLQVLVLSRIYILLIGAVMTDILNYICILGCTRAFLSSMKLVHAFVTVLSSVCHSSQL